MYDMLFFLPAERHLRICRHQNYFHLALKLSWMRSSPITCSVEHSFQPKCITNCETCVRAFGIVQWRHFAPPAPDAYQCAPNSVYNLVKERSLLNIHGLNLLDPFLKTTELSIAFNNGFTLLNITSARKHVTWYKTSGLWIIQTYQISWSGRKHIFIVQ